MLGEGNAAPGTALNALVKDFAAQANGELLPATMNGIPPLGPSEGMSGAFPDRMFKRAVQASSGRPDRRGQPSLSGRIAQSAWTPANASSAGRAGHAGRAACGRRRSNLAAIAAEPDIAAYRNDLGEALRMLGRLDAAAAEFESAITLNPDEAGAHANLGMVRHAQGQLSPATALYRHAISLDPKLAAAHMNLGVAPLLEQNEADAARLALEQADKLAPGDPAILLNLGQCAYSLVARFARLRRYTAAALPFSRVQRRCRQIFHARSAAKQGSGGAEA